MPLQGPKYFVGYKISSSGKVAKTGIRYLIASGSKLSLNKANKSGMLFSRTLEESKENMRNNSLDKIDPKSMDPQSRAFLNASPSTDVNSEGDNTLDKVRAALSQGFTAGQLKWLSKILKNIKPGQKLSAKDDQINGILNVIKMPDSERSEFLKKFDKLEKKLKEDSEIAEQYQDSYQEQEPELSAVDQAMSLKKNTGGIDLTPANMDLQMRNSNGEIKFRLDPAGLAQLQNAPGLVPVIINIKPLNDLRQFLSVNSTKDLPVNT
jgi:hypothetical protein